MASSVSLLDKAAPAPAATPVVYQNVIVTKGPVISPFLCVLIHGSNGSASSFFSPSYNNDPAFPNDSSWGPRDMLLGMVGRGIPVLNHDFFGVDPVTNLYEANQFGSVAVNGSIERARTLYAPMFGLRSDLIGLSGSSQGTEDCWFYLNQWPERVAYVVLNYPGVPDLELSRLDPTPAGANRRTSVNRSWLGAGHDTETMTLALASGAALRSKAWANGVSFAVNDYVADPNYRTRPPHVFGTYAYRCIRAHFAPAAPAQFNPADGNWAPLDPMGIHYTVPSEGGLSLAYPPSSPLAGLPATLMEPSNLTRMKSILDGTLPSLNGRKVPVWAYYSGGDNVANSMASNGAYPSAPWFFGRVGAQATMISPRAGETYGANHSGDLGTHGAPQPIDPRYQVVRVLAANGDTVAASPGANQEMLFHLDEAWTGGTVVFEQWDGTAWVALTVWPTVGVLATSTTEGANVTSATTPGWYRAQTANQVRARKTGGASLQVTVGPVFPPDAQYRILAESWLDDIAQKVLRVAA